MEIKTVKELREFTELTQVEFGRKYHIPVRSIQNWEGGQRTPTETILFLLNKAVMEDYKNKL